MNRVEKVHKTLGPYLPPLPKPQTRKLPRVSAVTRAKRGKRFENSGTVDLGEALYLCEASTCLTLLLGEDRILHFRSCAHRTFHAGHARARDTPDRSHRHVQVQRSLCLLASVSSLRRRGLKWVTCLFAPHVKRSYGPLDLPGFVFSTVELYRSNAVCPSLSLLRSRQGHERLNKRRLVTHFELNVDVRPLQQQDRRYDVASV